MRRENVNPFATSNMPILESGSTNLGKKTVLLRAVCFLALLLLALAGKSWLFDDVDSNQLLRTRRRLQEYETRPRAPAIQSLFSQLGQRRQLDDIYGASTMDGETTITRAIAACGECKSFSVYGIAENWDSPLLPAGLWVGKTITGTRDSETGEMALTVINNYFDGSTRYPAKLRVSPLAQALGSWFGFVFVFGFPPFKAIEQEDTLVIDYRPGWVPGVDGARPITQSGLEQAGINISDDISDMWAGYLVITLLGIFNVYSHYFVVQFDLDQMTIEM